MSVRIVTNIGEILIELYVKEVPRASRNFIKLCKLKYYHWCIFHRVEKDFVAQTGDPTATGKGGMCLEAVLDSKVPKYFPNEIVKRLKHEGKGVVGMANAGQERNGSQFYITLVDRKLDYLDEKHTIFGQVIEGLNVLDRINNNTFCDQKGRPLHDIYIKHTIIIDDPFDDPPGMISLNRSPPPSRVFTEMRRMSPEDEQAHQLGNHQKVIGPEEEPMLRRQREEARSRAITLEMIGERKSANLKPLENVLFVCKLNPLTEDDDLRMIFSRFGTIRNCEIIRDRQTGASLGYAFIDFEEKEACEEAYLKMDKVLIDDRRINVDFSQSVSKLHNQWVRDRDHRSNQKSSSSSSRIGTAEDSKDKKYSDSSSYRHRGSNHNRRTNEYNNYNHRSRSPSRNYKDF